MILTAAGKKDRKSKCRIAVEKKPRGKEESRKKKEKRRKGK
ncbi:MAG: hypothetical protein ACTSP4_09170 [Candidatus Hodarchaeales archaeon]